MVSFLHEMVIEQFRSRPALAAEMLRDVLGVALPAYEGVRIEEASLNKLQPVEYDADLVLLLEHGEPVFGIVLEVQLQPDADKPFSWLSYLAVLRARFRCPTLVLVVATDEATARWASQAVAIGPPGMSYAPVVLGPGLIPWVRDPAQAAAKPEVAVLSALARGNEAGGVDVVWVALQAVHRRWPEQADFYYDLFCSRLADAARRALEAIMLSTKDYEFKSPLLKENFAKGKAEGKVEGKAEGRVEGKAEALFDILDARGLALTDAQRERITTCNDLPTLNAWIKRAITVAITDEVFG